MVRRSGRMPGEVHEGCVYADGVLALRTRMQKVGETNRGVIGLPVTQSVVAHLRCDRCAAMFEARWADLTLERVCMRLFDAFTSPVERPAACSACGPSHAEQLVDVYLPSALDRFSVTPKRHGTTCVLCLRCGRLVWAHNAYAQEQERVVDELFSKARSS